jgi:Uma2 family endonuclease
MVAARAHFPKLTPAEYLEWEEQQERRYEYIDGEIYAMTGGTIDLHENVLIFAIGQEHNMLCKA